MTGRLTGRTAVVTGGSTGIGQEIARRLAAEGADIAVADIDPADETRDLVAETGRRFFSDKVDVSDEDDHVTSDEWRRTLRRQRGRPLPGLQGVPARPEGVRVGTDHQHQSSSYWTPPPPFLSYVSAKGALNGFTSVLAANLAAHLITVNGVAASLVRTATAAEKTSESFLEQTVRMQNIKRVQMGQIVVADGGSTHR
ncbi:SDR family NAD(P)-dependent oxidoreductase [Streptomyces coacervatus]|uniref:SDR family NAD(P)-dependent oxidoreductase n=1 Tax=Streptomyces coacervatus TaxID=647381 RepID=A0ABP7JCY0_9ACTN|nr:SDR family NAD(P)-dependent oxidoreductase [Streptomyces coacervatus]MDF2264334.1 SDR family NAD(P)-dependent oxidoreductase [Streptomyces coacervatus]